MNGQIHGWIDRDRSRDRKINEIDEQIDKKPHIDSWVQLDKAIYRYINRLVNRQTDRCIHKKTQIGKR